VYISVTILTVEFCSPIRFRFERIYCVRQRHRFRFVLQFMGVESKSKFFTLVPLWRYRLLCDIGIPLCCSVPFYLSG